MPPAVIDAMTDFRAALDRQEQSQSLRMAQAWLDITRSLDAELDRLALEAANAHASGRPLTRWHVSRMERYQSLMRQVGEQIRQFATVAGAEVTEAQWVAMQQGLDHSQQLIAMQLPGITGQFDRLPIEAIQNMVGIAGDGTPLERLLRDSFADAAPDIAGTLVRGVALGWHPTRTARAMRDAVNITLERAITVARTETARVYREASRQQYIRSGVVEGYIRVAAKSIRTCMACLIADGQFYTLDVPFEEHVNGRCTSIPKVRGVDIPLYETGKQWFLRQDEATQRQMMGPGRFEAWTQGKFDLAALVTRVENDTWGNSLHVTPLRDLLSGPVIPLTPAPPAPRLTYQVAAQQVATVEQHVLRSIEDYARLMNLSPDEVRSTIERVLNELVADAPVSVRFYASNLDGLRRTGRFLTQFETGTSGGAFAPDERARAEFKGLGYPLNIAPKERPIYGFFNINQDPNGAYWYGDLEFVLKREIRSRTTFTIGDSLANFSYNQVYGAPVDAPQIGAADTYIHELMTYANTGDKARLINRIYYVEAQVQGGVQLSDIDYVLDHHQQLSAADRRWLRGIGIGVR